MKKLAVANGQYTNAQNEVKTRWVNVGVIGVSSNGKEYMLIDPTINFAGFPREEGKDMVMVGIFDDSQQGQNNNSGQPQQQSYNLPQQQQYGQPQQQMPTVYQRQDGTFHDGNGTELNQDGSLKYPQQQ